MDYAPVRGNKIDRLSRLLAITLLIYEGVLVALAFVDFGIEDPDARGAPRISATTQAALWFRSHSAAIKLAAFFGALSAYMAFMLLRASSIKRTHLWCYLFLATTTIIADVCILAFLISRSPITLRLTGVGTSLVIYSWGVEQMLLWSFLAIPLFTWIVLAVSGRIRLN